MPTGASGGAGGGPSPMAGAAGGPAPVAGTGGTPVGPPPAVRFDAGRGSADAPSDPRTATVTLIINIEGGQEGGGGTVRVSSGATCSEGSCPVLLERGTRVSLEAAPDQLSVFEGWGESCSGSGACTVVMDTDRSVSVVFKPALWKAPPGMSLYSLVIGGDNIYLGGRLNESAQIADTTLNPIGESDEVLVALTPALQPRWARKFSAPMFENINGLSVAPNGSLVVSGTWQSNGPLTFEGRTISPQSGPDTSTFLGVLDPTGRLVSAQGPGGCNGMEVDSRGYTYHYPWFYPAQLTKKTLDGQTQWTYPEEWSFFLSDLTIDRSDSAVLCASTVNPVTLRVAGGPRTVNVSDLGLVVLKVNADGAGQWITMLQNARRSAQDFAGCSLVTDGRGDVYITGTYTGSLTLGGQTIRSVGDQDAFIARLTSSNGNLAWLKTYGSPMRDVGRMLAVDDAGDLVFAMLLDAPANLGGMTVEPYAALLRVSAANGAVMGPLLPLPAKSSYVVAMARHVASGDFFMADELGTVRRVRLRP
jgi:hypothetical protein